MKFRHILADCPWLYNQQRKTASDGTATAGIGACHHYNMMPTPELCSLGDLIKSVCSPLGALLHLWATGPRLPDALAVMTAWGFEYCSIEFVWVKLNKGQYERAKADMLTTTFFVGKDAVKPDVLLEALCCKLPGHYSMSNVELVLVGRRGKKAPTIALSEMPYQIVAVPNTTHSHKPEQVQDRLDKAYPDQAKLELFARRLRANWVTVGNECPASMGEDIRDSLRRLELHLWP